MTRIRKALVALALAASMFLIMGSAFAPSASASLPYYQKPRVIAWEWAFNQRGKPYIWGGIGPRGFDCSGLVMMAYRHAYKYLPRTTYAMLNSGKLRRTHHPKRGVLAFYGRGHVEIYYKAGWTFGAHHTGTRIGFTHYNSAYHPSAFYFVR